MKLKLISPAVSNLKKNILSVAPITLAYIAALTPPDVEVTITDELIESIDFDEEIDLVGITTITATAKRAYQIADEFRRRNKPVVIGGVHTTVVPDEAKKHSDAVVVGEAEGSWQRLIEDFKKGQLKKYYRNDKLHSLRNYTIPRRDLFKKEKYLTVNTVETSRGCPCNCYFCYVSTLYGTDYRNRPVDEVIEEIKSLEGHHIFFTANNIAENPDYMKELAKKLIPYKKKWVGQANLSIAKDDELLKLMVQSGCVSLFIGFESLSEEPLKEMAKMTNIGINYFQDAIKKFLDYGLVVIGGFIFGFDTDDKTIFKKTVDFVKKNGPSVVQFDILTPYPGTPLYKKLNEEGRLINKQWWLEDERPYVYYYPNLMSPNELFDGWLQAAKENYSVKSILKRTWRWRRSLGRLVLTLKWNIFYQRLYYKKVPSKVNLRPYEVEN